MSERLRLDLTGSIFRISHLHRLRTQVALALRISLCKLMIFIPPSGNSRDDLPQFVHRASESSSFQTTNQKRASLPSVLPRRLRVPEQHLEEGELKGRTRCCCELSKKVCNVKRGERRRCSTALFLCSFFST